MLNKPRNLYVIRHGESEGNLANRRSRYFNDHSHFTPEFRVKPHTDWEVTEAGCEQARQAGAWLRAHGHTDFTVRMVSPYVRTRQTANLLGLLGPWIVHRDLRERSIGDLEAQSWPHPERVALFQGELARREAEGMSWRPPNGESLLDVIERVAGPLEEAYRLADGGNVIMVSHMETMLPIRYHLEGLTHEQFALAHVRGSAGYLEIGNCRMLHYTRVDPCTGTIDTEYRWMRSVCAISNPSPHGWIAINRSNS